MPWLPGHRGVDLAAERGDVVRAARAGTVTVAGDIAGRGVVVVSHLGGLRTTYEPVVAVVAVGDAVDAGDVIGTLAGGDVHCGGGPERGHSTSCDSASLARSCSTALVCIWQMRDSVTPSTWPISARVRPS